MEVVQSEVANCAPALFEKEEGETVKDVLHGDEIPPRKKSRLQLGGNADGDQRSDPPSSDTKTKLRKTKAQMQEAEDMDWVCALCKEAECMMQPNADEFLICDGGCQRVFHYPCAGLAQIPDKHQDWICQDCSQGRHACAFCHEFGQDQLDVFKCRKDKCGLFFHESCLAMNNVPVKMEQIITQEQTLSDRSSPKNVEANPLGNDIVSDLVPVFTCPAHQCWTCTQEEEIQREREEAEAQRKEVGKKKTTKKRGKKIKSIFMCKTEGRLFRCLHCPMAYHVTCLPPTTKVNELGVLCPDHATTHKLPDIDLSTSIQRKIEARIDRQLDKISGQIRARRLITGLGGRGTFANPFFPGLRGDRLTEAEQDYVNHVVRGGPDSKAEGGEDGVLDVATVAAEVECGGLSFCLPVDIRSEVHSKPPNYTLIHGLRYDPNNRPKKIASTGEQCQCTDTCDNRCFNRMSLVECVGDGPNSNCRLGPLKCDNRALGLRQFVKCKPKRESGKGWGLITESDIPKGKLIQEYVGEVIDELEKERRLIAWNMEHPNDPNFYVMGLGTGWYVDAREYANMSRFINHSCDPNCQVTTINVKGCNRNGIYSLRDIAAGEFLSYDYNFDTKQADRFACRCGATNCRGTMQGGGGGMDGSKKPASWKEAKTKYDSDVRQLAELNSKQVISQVDCLIPAAEKPTELVSNGPTEKHRGSSLGVFLWRNVVCGSDFVARNSRLETFSEE